MPTVYYKVHGGRLTFGEYWRMSPDPFTFMIAAVFKLFGGLSFNFTIPRVDELHKVEWDFVRAPARRQLGPLMEDLENIGFEFLFCHQLPVLEQDRMGVGAVLLSPDKRTFAMVIFAQDKVNKQLHISLVSVFENETFGVTTTQKKQMNPDPRNAVARHPNTGPEELYEKHQKHLEEWEAEDRIAVKLTKESVAAATLRGEQEHVDFHVERGIYVPMTRAEIRKIRAQQDELFEDDE